jgi:competence protein ComEC
MFAWNKYPLLRILIPFVAGVFFVFYSKLTFSLWILFSFILIFSILIIILYRFRKYSNRWVNGIFFVLTIFLIGITYTQLFINQGKPPPELLSGNKKQTFIASIIESPVEKTNSIKATARIDSYIAADNSWKKSDTKAVIHIQKNEQAKELQYGDKVVISSFLNEPSRANNPHAFDYKRYLSIKNIYLQSYVHTDNWTKIAERTGSPIIHLATDIRQKFLKIFADADMDIQQYGIIAAILLGYDDELDPDLSRSYSASGVSHILCVSGMHVGIIFMIFSFLLQFLDKNRFQRTIRTFILLLTIWLYACITGLAPSVMRAATMFSFVAIAGVINRRTNSYNSLLASMLFLLCINPLIILELGFQFSYLAVLGIVWLQKAISSLYRPKTKAGDHVWDIISVSLVAQLFTAPLGILYFHQFPNYFLLANIIVITLTPVIVGFGIAVLVFSFWAFAYKYLSLGLMYLIKFMNWSILSIEKLPYSLTENIYFSPLEVILIYVFIILLACAFKYKNKQYLFQAIGLAIVIITLDISMQLQINGQKEITFYSLRSGFVIEQIHGRNSILYTDSTGLTNKQTYDFNIKSNHTAHRINQMNTIGNMQFLQCHGKDILVLNQPIFAFPLQEKLKTDYVLLNANMNISIDNLLKMIDFKMLLIGNNCSYYRSESIRKTCAEKMIPFHDLKQQGALVVRF